MSMSEGPRVLPDAREEQAVDALEASRGKRSTGPFGQLRDRWNNLPRAVQWAWLLIVVALAYALPYLNFFPLSTAPGNDWALACFSMAVYALIAIGLNVVVGYAGLLDLGYVAFFAVGSYTAAMLTSPDSPFVKIPYLWTIPVAIAVTMTFGIILGVPTLRLRGDYLAIVTLGFGEIVRILATIIPAMKGQVGFQNVGHPPGENADGIPIFSNSNGVPWYWLTITVIIVILLLVGNLERSRVGRAWVAIREDEDAAEIMGVPTFKYKVWAFAIGAGVGGLSGALFAGQVGFVNNQKFDVQTSILFLAAVVLGGAGNKVGAMLGGAIVAYIPLRFTVIADYKYLIFGIALVLIMIFRSQGLFPARQKLLAYGRHAYRRVADAAKGRPGPRTGATPVVDSGALDADGSAKGGAR
ncbi:amino acid/amide ABC transporter membrane protein 2, HAAT family [Leifsonia sp. 98AMF]|uniref:branched-chain amino acid ABC transporter permease n=1 Tax=Microbacteriaceae TaxID=85023 RepID=UPI000376DF20|nr:MULTISPECIES: branched-chain amino acid ABC transporter permease [Microbacteriaceae]TDQ03484.1 amino acid/amide ABC transporter membrane protein 2 (HAAT family) [Leifsonia sp. 115AMFTsu3.1]SDH29753.1 amino acid/amide ABC transporter membrane protein 2, HAAT family [Leifsonia sp. 197AMF]SDJ07411.1 amino acid/amide ABC transporter membrane protein 2, HAAT family [Leifsonia sp. 466MF]SDJ63932.1 amino acid/amide ABC transporter membrane protein 2, HAAT family [Leifsonia sp. 157MF]SDN28311.1 ami